MKHGIRTLIALSGAVLGAGCTFLISFEAADPGPDGGDIDATPNAPDAERTFDVRAEPDPPQDAGRDWDLDSLTACKGHLDGLYCNGNQNVTVTGADNDDLVTCIGGKVNRIRFCDKGNGCIRMLDGYPDQCDECFKKGDGVYCGPDLGWHPQNKNQRVRCQSGSQVGLLLCGTCVPNGASSYCK